MAPSALLILLVSALTSQAIPMEDAPAGVLSVHEDWQEDDGGQLRLYTDVEKGINGPFIDVLPKAGTVVIFRSGSFWHEVRPSKKPRLSLTGWLRGRG